jgi:hypothetical protein
MESEMISFSKIAAGLVVGLVVTSTLPALGANRSVSPSQNARAHATMQYVDGIVSPDRARALLECNGKVAGLAEQTLGNHRLAIYRACMAERGEAE